MSLARILSCARVLATLLASLPRCLLQLGRGAFECLISCLRLILTDHQDSLAEWSKALAPGASPQGRGFEPHSCHCSDVSSGSPVGKPVGVSRTLGGSRARRCSLARARWRRRKHAPQAYLAMFSDISGDHHCECLRTNLDCNTAIYCCYADDACKRSCLAEVLPDS